jgi:farnesyl-diphosphate farnesyltransferase
VNSDSSQALAQHQADLQFQAAMLPGVSRTFALTIPVLPAGLADVVANAYLLCRLADTIEDDVGLDSHAKTAFHERLVGVVRGDGDAARFSSALEPLLSNRTLAAERVLVTHADRIIRVTHSFSRDDQQAIVRCLSKMCTGMPEFQRHKSIAGLVDLDEMGAYCYVVAGVVGEMLTELFCAHRPGLGARQHELMRLAPAFGQGLQMTNILKDVWEDRRAQTCWLPRCVFGSTFDLARLDELHATTEYRRGIEQLVGIAHHHLRAALDYALLVPTHETGLRRFCLWAIGLAVLTLRKVLKHCGHHRGERVKISRSAVATALSTVNLLSRNDRSLRAVFRFASAGLPLVATQSVAGLASAGRRQTGASRA